MHLEGFSDANYKMGNITNDEAINAINHRNNFKYDKLTQDFLHEWYKKQPIIVISAHEHLKKPDEKIFKILLERYNLTAEECLFIDDDDTNRSYITANELGILGRKVKPNSREDIIKLLNEVNIEI